MAVLMSVLILQEFVLCRSDQNRERIKGFYLEDKDSVDVVFIGASEVYAGFSSVYAYSKYRFTSYPVAVESNPVTNYLTCIKEAVRTQHPKLIVIEINGVLYSDDFLGEEVNLRRYADNIPLNENKLELIERYTSDKKLEYVMPITKYHMVWKDFSADIRWGAAAVCDRFRGCTLLKGVKNLTRSFTPRGKILNDMLSEVSEKKELGQKSSKAFTELLEYCKENDLNVLFTRFPHIIYRKELLRYGRSLTAAEMIKSYGFDYIGFDDKYSEIGLDLSKDFYNTEHLNIYGQVKFTDYLCRYLCDNCGIKESHLTEAQRKKWDNCVDYYNVYCLYNDELIQNKKAEEVGEDIISMIQIKKRKAEKKT